MTAFLDKRCRKWSSASNVRRKILYNARDFTVSRTCRAEIRARREEDCARFALRANLRAHVIEETGMMLRNAWSGAIESRMQQGHASMFHAHVPSVDAEQPMPAGC
ncbi:MAG TPA: hypothetical protein VMN56_22455 [Casimicrobiaceae bacterium]|nr:hypothetical protein [Casimicrobiaceae bacterium]